MTDFMLTWIGKKYITRTILYVDSSSIQDADDHYVLCGKRDERRATTMGDGNGGIGVPKGNIVAKRGAVKGGAKKAGAKKAGAKKAGAKKGGAKKAGAKKRR